MKRLILTEFILLQIIFTIFVYNSNQKLAQKIIATHAAGFLTVPNLKVLPSLSNISSACAGGLFFNVIFSLSVIIISFFFIKIYDFLKNPQINFLKKTGRHFFSFLILIILWSTCYQHHFFLNIRDALLANNFIGIKIINFYYRYNLYAAESLKNITQKQLKTCNLELISDQKLKAIVTQKLWDHNFYPLKTSKNIDLNIEQQKDGELVFKNFNQIILTTNIDYFLLHTKKILIQFSQAIDQYKFLRITIFWLLLIILPLFGYLLLYKLFKNVIFSITNFSKKSFNDYQVGGLASITCLIISFIIWLPIYKLQNINVQTETIQNQLVSNIFFDRIAALRYIYYTQQEINNFKTKLLISKSSPLPEQYWFIKALGVSYASQTYQKIFTFLDSDHPEIVSAAIESLGKRSKKKDVPFFIKKLQTSSHWYEQRQIYRILKNLNRY